MIPELDLGRGGDAPPFWLGAKGFATVETNGGRKTETAAGEAKLRTAKRKISQRAVA